MTAHFNLVIKTEDKSVVEFKNARKKVARLHRNDDDDDFYTEPPVLNSTSHTGNPRILVNAEENLVSVDPQTNTFMFKNGNVTIELTRKQYSDDHYYSRLF